MHAWLKPVLDTAKCEIAYFCCMHILCPKILSRGVKYIQEILNRKFYTLQISDLSLNKHVNEGLSSCIICHFHFLLHCHCSMKQRQEEKCPKVLLWELLFFSNSCVKFWFLPSSTCKMTSASEYFLLISTILVMRLPFCYQEVWPLEKVRFKFQKGLGFSLCCEQPEGSMLTSLEPHPAPGTRRSLLAQHGQPKERPIRVVTESPAASSNLLLPVLYCFGFLSHNTDTIFSHVTPCPVT